MKKLLIVSALLALGTGGVLVGGATWGVCFTYSNVAQEKIVTPDDASIPGASVRGPFTLKAQADVIRKHTLASTGGLTFAEMPRQVPKLDAEGKPILDGEGKPVMAANTARDIWITATTLTTALNLGIITYAFSGLVLLFGLISMWTGVVFLSLARRQAA